MTDMFERENTFAKEMKETAVITSGSDKQISWARGLIQEAVFVITTSVFNGKEFDQAQEFCKWYVGKHTDAKYWINNKGKGYRFYGLLREDWEDEM